MITAIQERKSVSDILSSSAWRNFRITCKQQAIWRSLLSEQEKGAVCLLEDILGAEHFMELCPIKMPELNRDLAKSFLTQNTKVTEKLLWDFFVSESLSAMRESYPRNIDKYLEFLISVIAAEVTLASNTGNVALALKIKYGLTGETLITARKELSVADIVTIKMARKVLGNRPLKELLFCQSENCGFTKALVNSWLCSAEKAYSSSVSVVNIAEWLASHFHINHEKKWKQCLSMKPEDSKGGCGRVGLGQVNFDTLLNECELSTRHVNVLEAIGIFTVGDLLTYKKEELLELRNLGLVAVRCLVEIGKRAVENERNLISAR